MSEVKHGTISGYGRACRCDLCRAANTERQRRNRQRRAARLATATVQHGTASTYSNWLCRCEPCTKAHLARMAADAKARKDKAAPTHGVSGYRHFGCRCQICTDAAREMHARRWRKYADNETAEQKRTRIAAGTPSAAESYRRYQAETADRARNNGKQWTGPEMEMAARTDLTVREIALAIGRTYAAVTVMRNLLRTDPKIIAVAGLTRGRET